MSRGCIHHLANEYKQRLQGTRREGGMAVASLTQVRSTRFWRPCMHSTVWRSKNRGQFLRKDPRLPPYLLTSERPCRHAFFPDDEESPLTM